MPIDLCQTNRFSLVGEMRQLTATRPSAICAKMSAAIDPVEQLGGRAPGFDVVCEPPYFSATASTWMRSVTSGLKPHCGA